MLPDTTYETMQAVFARLFMEKNNGPMTELFKAIEAVYEQGTDVSVSLTLSLSRFGDQQIDVKAVGAVIINANEKPVWKPEKVAGESRIRINDRQIRLTGM
jgi:hypothetical protein